MATKKTKTKTKTPTEDKLESQDFDLFKAIEAIDRKDYSWFSSLTDEQQRKFTAYMLTHWVSAVKADGPVAAYYTMSVNENANKYLLNEKVQHHPELQWLMLCASSPGIGKQYHKWIPHLSPRITRLQEKATKKEIRDYFGKVFVGVDSETIESAADEFTAQQNHKVRLSKLYPEMKPSDIETLSKIVTSQELDQYEKDSGN